MPSWENNVRKVIPYTPGEQPKIPDITWAGGPAIDMNDEGSGQVLY